MGVQRRAPVSGRRGAMVKMSKNDPRQRTEAGLAGARRAIGHAEADYALRRRRASLWINLCIKKVAVKPEAQIKNRDVQRFFLDQALLSDPRHGAGQLPPGVRESEKRRIHARTARRRMPQPGRPAGPDYPRSHESPEIPERTRGVTLPVPALTTSARYVSRNAKNRGLTRFSVCQELFPQSSSTRKGFHLESNSPCLGRRRMVQGAAILMAYRAWHGPTLTI